MKKMILFCLMFLVLFTGCSKENNILPEETIIEDTIDKVETSKIEVAKQTTLSIKKTAEIYYLELQLLGEVIDRDILIDFYNTASIPENFVFNGITPTSGTVIITEDGTITLKDIVIDNLTCNIEESNEVICK